MLKIDLSLNWMNRDVGAPKFSRMLGKKASLADIGKRQQGALINDSRGPSSS